MADEMNKLKRAAVYVFYDEKGIVDSYVEYFLEDLRKNVNLLVVVCNGKLLQESREKLQKFTIHVFARDNKGYDIAAYQAGLEYIGWDKLTEYDEIVLANDTVYGPIYPFKEMFDCMAERELDFWGITRHYEIDANPYNCEYGCIPEHIQSYFMVLRKRLLGSYEFVKYWRNLPSIRTYKDAVGKHELRFTKYFADMGFIWDTYINTHDLEVKNPQPLMVYAKELIQNRRCPIFKRRLFFQDYDWILENSVGQGSIDAFEYIRDYTSYDTNMVLENLLRVCNQADLTECLHFNYILSSKLANVEKMEKVIQAHKVALVMHIHYMDLLAEAYRYVSVMPPNTDIYLVTNAEEKKEKIEKYFGTLDGRKLEVRVTQNRGRDIASLLTGTKDVIFKYEYICFVHDKKTKQLQPESIGEGFAYKCLQNMLYNTNYVYNILETFEDNPKLGLLSPPEPSHADFFPTIGHEWGENFEITKKLAESMNLHVKMDEEKSHQSPLGDYFWFRTKALKRLFDMGWEYEDYPEEPVGVDGSLLHAIERIHSFVAQEDGFYSGHMMVDNYARIEYTNLRHQLRGFNKALQKNNIWLKAISAHEMVDLLLKSNNRYNGEFQHAVDIIQYNESQIERWKKEFQHAVEIIQYNEKVIEAQKRELSEVYESSSWKVTSPMRKLMRLFKQ